MFADKKTIVATVKVNPNFVPDVQRQIPISGCFR